MLVICFVFLFFFIAEIVDPTTPKLISVKKGRFIIFRCNFLSITSWQFSGEVWPRNAMLLDDQHVVVITEVDLSNSGSYNCIGVHGDTYKLKPKLLSVQIIVIGRCISWWLGAIDTLYECMVLMHVDTFSIYLKERVFLCIIIP